MNHFYKGLLLAVLASSLNFVDANAARSRRHTATDVATQRHSHKAHVIPNTDQVNAELTISNKVKKIRKDVDQEREALTRAIHRKNEINISDLHNSKAVLEAAKDDFERAGDAVKRQEGSTLERAEMNAAQAQKETMEAFKRLKELDSIAKVRAQELLNLHKQETLEKKQAADKLKAEAEKAEEITKKLQEHIKKTVGIQPQLKQLIEYELKHSQLEIELEREHTEKTMPNKKQLTRE